MNIKTPARTLAIVCAAFLGLAACDRKPASLPPEQRASGGQNNANGGGAPSMTGGDPGPSASSGGNVTGPINNPTPTAPTGSEPSSIQGPGSSAPAPGSDASASEADRTFVAAATKSGLAEVAAGRYVAVEGRDPEVKAFAERLQQDHSAANAQLARLASARNIPADTRASDQLDEDLVELRKASADKIDALFLARFGTSAHQETIALFERQAREGTDEELRAFANDTLAVLRRHLDAARALERKLAGGGR